MTRHLTIDEVGDIAADPGTKEWAIGVKNRLMYLLEQVKTTEKHIDPYLDLLDKYQGYKQLENELGQPFQDISQFIQARYPFGLNDDERIRQWASKARERVQAAAGETTGETIPVHANQYTVDRQIVYPQSERAKQNGIGVVTQKKLDHLARNRPDLLQHVKTGELSADKAYKISRGIKDPTPLDKLKKEWRKASYDEKITFLEWIEGVKESPNA